MKPDVQRRALRRAITVIALTVALLGLAPAHADPPVAQAWWWAPQNESLNLPSQVGSLLPERPGPQGVPDDGLYVAATAASEEAVAVVRFFVAEDAEPTQLELVLAGDPVGEPVIRLCEVKTSWTPVQQGAWSNRPEFDCAEDARVGTLSEDGARISFDLTGLGLAGMVDFGLAPGIDETGSIATFQAPIEKPGVDALQFRTTAPGGDDAAVPVATTPGAPAPPATTPAPPATEFVVPRQPTAAGPVNLTPVATQAPVAASGGGAFAAAPTANDLPMVPASSGDTLRTVGMIGLVALAGFYAWLTRQESRAPTSLLAFGRGTSGPVIGAGVLK